ncbi:(R)-2-hydroxyglutaryl-CoA dehydratase subunit beta [Anaerohalosphaera lusitana]|uniref:(R)-2-hydroxyglutaryl-CoA dehydratase subunit beta n=1 Tax=Anaerohalosphaera lusitana TaxID=1936003 RepID=A0A1U9NK72_9BACT|nr:double-cubane-cluster-containing anaerobic reductase [Anaerohalosphaera lusitana]AQT68215.1 (R)-2-hydroxyglutaryl-CoA dehydratase subunit beta [Anaerohalosphaera lusitana]
MSTNCGCGAGGGNGQDERSGGCGADDGCGGASGPLGHFENMISNCYEYATAAKESGRGIVGIMCEYTPREVIMAAGALPVCLCGGSAEKAVEAHRELPANLCPLIKSTYGYVMDGSNLFLKMADVVVAETTCDGKKKMYELMARKKDMIVLELVQKPGEEGALARWTAEVVKLRDRLGEKLGVEITDEKLWEAVRVMNRERRLRRRIAELMEAEDPPLSGSEVLAMKSTISGIEADLVKYEEAAEYYGSGAAGSVGENRVRVLLTGVPTVHGAEKVVKLIEEAGGVVVCMENCTGVKPILEDVDEEAEDAIEAIAAKYLHLPCSVMTPNAGRLESIERLAKQYRADCVVDLVWQACLTYDVESRLVKELAEGELGLPYLKIETDYSPSDAARIAVRLEAMFEMVEGN